MSSVFAVHGYNVSDGPDEIEFVTEIYKSRSDCAEIQAYLVLG